MTNHSFVTTKKHIIKGRFSSYLNELVMDKFSSYAVIDKDEDDSWFDIEITDNNRYIGSVSITVLSQRKLSFRQGHSEFSAFLQHWLACSIGIHYNGMRSDEGLDPKERWKPEIKANNYLEWLNYMEDESVKRYASTSPSKQDMFKYLQHRRRSRKMLTENITEELLKM